MTWKTKKLDRALETRLATGPERGGVVLRSGSIVELENISEEPLDTYMPDLAELVELEDDMVATWHTHPGQSAALSGMDWDTFCGWPELLHAIVGADGVRWYKVAPSGVAVLNA